LLTFSADGLQQVACRHGRCGRLFSGKLFGRIDMLKLSHERNDHDDTLKFERRRVPRMSCESNVTAYYSNGSATPGEARFGVVQMKVTDASAAGIGCRSSRPLEHGMRVSICPAGIPAAYTSGTVVRCRQTESGHFDIGVQFVFAQAKVG